MNLRDITKSLFDKTTLDERIGGFVKQRIPNAISMFNPTMGALSRMQPVQQAVKQSAQNLPNYIQNRVIGPIKPVVGAYQNYLMKPSLRNMGRLAIQTPNALMAAYNTTPVGMVTNSIESAISTGLQGLRNKTPINQLPKLYSQNVANPMTGIGTTGLGLKGGVGMAVDMLAMNPKSAANAFRKLGNKSVAKGFSLPKATMDELVDASEMIKNPQNYLGKIKVNATTEKEALKAIQAVGAETVDRLSGKYLPNKYLNLPIEKQIKALTDLHYKNGLANVSMGIYGGKSATGYKGATKFSNMTDKQPRFEIDDSKAKLLDKSFPLITKEIRGYKGYLLGTENTANNVKLSEVLDHPKLFKEYPWLKNIDVEFGNKEFGTKGSFDGKRIIVSGKIIGDDVPGSKGWRSTNQRYVLTEDDKSTLLHEIQHAIQQKEGFARGGSPVSATQFVRQQSGIEDIGKAISIKNYTELAKRENPSLTGDALFKKADEIFKRGAGASDSLLTNLDQKVKDLVENNSTEFLRNKYKELSKPTSKNPFEDYYDNYNRLSGEVESRDVQSRMNLTPEQRLSTQPLSSQGIPLKDQIVRMDGKNVAQSTLQDIKPTLKTAATEPVVPPGKIRGFAKTVKEDLTVPKEVRDFAKTLTYDQLPNKTVMDRVSQIVKQGDAQAIDFAKNGDTTEANATALVMIRKLLAENRHTEAQDLIAAVSPRFTKQGQQIQILSQFGKLKPEGAIKYAQSIIDKANLDNPNLKLKLTEQNVKAISEKATAIQALAEGSRERLVATAQLMKEISTVVPPSIGQKLSTIQTMAQLLNPKTAIRNILGNSIFAGLENVSDTVGTGVDKAVSLATGQRSKVLPSLKAQGQGLVRGAKEGMEDIKLGVDTSGGISGQFDLPTSTFTKGALSKLEKVMKIELGVPDRAAFTAAYEGSLNNQMRAAGVTKPTDQMLEVAQADGMYRTFQDNSTLAQIFGGAKKLLNKIGTPDGKFGLGDFILKYPKTPANILSRGIDYTPAGFIKGVYEIAKPLINGQQFNQKTFVEDLSRAMVGTGVISAAYMLAKNGIVTGKSPKDYDVSATQQASGGGKFKINVSALKRFALSGGKPQTDQTGDTLVSYDWAQPTSLVFSMGADMALNGTGKNAITDSLDTATQTVTGQPLVQGMTQFGKDIQDKGVGTALTKSALGAPSGFTPSILNSFASLFDKTARSTYDPNKITESKNKVQARIPGWRNQLQPAVDIFGQPKQNYESQGLARIADVMFNPAFVTTIKNNPAAAEVLNIYAKSGETQQAPRVADKSVKINGQNVQLNPQQYTQYQTYIGTKTQQVFDSLVSNPTFMNANDEDKAKLMASALSDINTAAKVELFGNQPKTISNSAKQYIGNTPVNPVSFTKEGNLKFSTGITYPKLTGQKEVDKKLLSSYYSQITTASNDVINNYNNGVITAAQAETQLQQLKALKAKSSGGRKAKKISFKITKPKKLKAIKIKAIKIPKLKITKGKKIKATKLKVA